MGILMLNFRIQYGLIHSLIDRLVYRLIHSFIDCFISRLSAEKRSDGFSDDETEGDEEKGEYGPKAHVYTDEEEEEEEDNDEEEVCDERSEFFVFTQEQQNC